MDAMDVLTEAVGREGAGALATIVAAEGHAYRKSGAFMLLCADGRTIGAISPGCLESDLQQYAEHVIEQNTSQFIEYDMRSEDDLSWGEHIGCGGYLRILMEPLTGGLMAALREACDRLRLGETIQLIRSFEAGANACFYRVAPAEASSPIVDRLLWTAPAEGEPSQLSLRIEAKPRLILFGAGDDSLPVHRLALLAGFCVTVTDFREALCTEKRFPGASLQLGFPSESLPRLRLSREDYVVIMSHNFLRDLQFLRLSLTAAPCYVGIMGSRSRTERLLADSLVVEALKVRSEWAASGLRYPVGLPIGAEGPEEIAISIMAELIQARRGRVAHGKAGHSGTVSWRGEQPPHGALQAFNSPS
ncbi:XdhC/CoxI family protein [Paenibacillus sp. HB172176]|uniref:XdhC family protein n=1 Tax=Paenibacillus sp. HB172176 TaxID=2493690 RepID=UPI00143AF9E4|nr:XdhC/CoxI family protein [Paenibacillus sp. HB172176]